MDGVNNDMRLAIDILNTARTESNLDFCNYLQLDQLKINTKTTNVTLTDVKTNQKLNCTADFVINCTGPYSDKLRLSSNFINKPVMSVSAGTHLVFSNKLLGDN